MNMFVFMGRLCKDAEVTKRNETVIAKCNIAVDRAFKKEGQATADFFQLTAFSKKAEFLQNYGKKGVKFLVKGHIANNNYEKDGKTIYQDAFIVDEIEFCEKKNSEDKPKENFDTADDFMNIPDDIDEELPFN